MMISVDFMSGKGGTGKTTLALHTAAMFAHNGIKTAVLDLDRDSASASSWYAYAKEQGREVPFVVTRERNVKCDVLIVDHPPHIDSKPLGEVVVLTVRPAMFDVLAARRAAASLKNTRVIDVLNALNVSRSEEKQIAEDIEPAVVVRDRSIYKRTLSAGFTLMSPEVATWYSAGNAKREINEIYQQIMVDYFIKGESNV